MDLENQFESHPVAFSPDIDEEGYLEVLKIIP